MVSLEYKNVPQFVRYRPTAKKLDIATCGSQDIGSFTSITGHRQNKIVMLMLHELKHHYNINILNDE